jgi:hypothetical protein
MQESGSKGSFPGYQPLPHAQGGSSPPQSRDFTDTAYRPSHLPSLQPPWGDHHSSSLPPRDSREQKEGHRSPISDAVQENFLPRNVATHHRKRLLKWGIRYALVVLFIGIPLAIPVIVFRKNAVADQDTSPESEQYRNLVFYIFLWLCLSWAFAVIFDIIALAIPYLFRLIAR